MEKVEALVLAKHGIKRTPYPAVQTNGVVEEKASLVKKPSASAKPAN